MQTNRAAHAADGDEAMEGSDDEEQGQELLALQAAADDKQADFETRKRARLTDEFNSDKGGCGGKCG